MKRKTILCTIFIIVLTLFVTTLNVFGSSLDSSSFTTTDCSKVNYLSGEGSILLEEKNYGIKFNSNFEVEYLSNSRTAWNTLDEMLPTGVKTNKNEKHPAPTEKELNRWGLKLEANTPSTSDSVIGLWYKNAITYQGEVYDVVMALTDWTYSLPKSSEDNCVPPIIYFNPEQKVGSYQFTNSVESLSYKLTFYKTGTYDSSDNTGTKATLKGMMSIFDVDSYEASGFAVNDVDDFYVNNDTNLTQKNVTKNGVEYKMFTDQSHQLASSGDLMEKQPNKYSVLFNNDTLRLYFVRTDNNSQESADSGFTWLHGLQASNFRQYVKSQYQEGYNEETITGPDTQEQQCYVEFIQPSTFTVKIPKVLILDGSSKYGDEETNGAEYYVEITGDLDEEQYISVYPSSDTFELTNATSLFKNSVTAQATIDKKETYYEDGIRSYPYEGINSENYASLEDSLAAYDENTKIGEVNDFFQYRTTNDFTYETSSVEASGTYGAAGTRVYGHFPLKQKTGYATSSAQFLPVTPFKLAQYNCSFGPGNGFLHGYFAMEIANGFNLNVDADMVQDFLVLGGQRGTIQMPLVNFEDKTCEISLWDCSGYSGERCSTFGNFNKVYGNPTQNVIQINGFDVLFDTESMYYIDDSGLQHRITFMGGDGKKNPLNMDEFYYDLFFSDYMLVTMDDYILKIKLEDGSTSILIKGNINANLKQAGVYSGDFNFFISLSDTLGSLSTTNNPIIQTSLIKSTETVEGTYADDDPIHDVSYTVKIPKYLSGINTNKIYYTCGAKGDFPSDDYFVQIMPKDSIPTTSEIDFYLNRGSRTITASVVQDRIYFKQSDGLNKNTYLTGNGCITADEMIGAGKWKGFLNFNIELIKYSSDMEDDMFTWDSSDNTVVTGLTVKGIQHLENNYGALVLPSYTTGVADSAFSGKNLTGYSPSIQTALDAASEDTSIVVTYDGEVYNMYISNDGVFSTTYNDGVASLISSGTYIKYTASNNTWNIAEGVSNSICESKEVSNDYYHTAIKYANKNISINGNGVYNIENNTSAVVTNNSLPKTSLIQSIKVFNKGIENIGQYAFAYNNELKSINQFPVDLKVIDKFAFNSNPLLANLPKFPSSLTDIKDDAFRFDYALTEVDLSDCANLSYIGQYSFNTCTALKKVLYNPNLTSINKYAFYGDTVLTQFGDNENEIFIDKNITTINGYSFANCTSLTKIAISDENVLTNIGEYAFSGCSSLNDFNINANLKTIGNCCFYKCISLTNVVAEDESKLTGIGNSAFSGCSSLNDFDFSHLNSLTTLGNNVFTNTSNLNVDIQFPMSLKSIDFQCFSHSNIKSVDFSLSSITSIPYKCFEYCPSLTTIVNNGITTVVNYNSFYNCTSLVNFNTTDTMTKFGECSFYGCSSLKRFNNDEYLIIPSGLDTLNRYVFQNCKSIEKADFTQNDKLSVIKASLFKDCTSLSDVVLNKAIIYDVESNAFDGCKSITEFNFANIRNIGDYAFRYTLISEITVGNDATTLGIQMLAYTPNLKRININSNSLTSVADQAFRFCGTPEGYASDEVVDLYINPEITSLTTNFLRGTDDFEKFNIHTGTNSKLASISSYAFSYITSNSYLYLSDSPKNITSDSFYSAPTLIVFYGGSETDLTNAKIGNCKKTLYDAVNPFAYEEGDENIVNINDMLYQLNNDGTASVFGYIGSSESFTLTKTITYNENTYSVTDIPNGAFTYNHGELKTLNVPLSVDVSKDAIYNTSIMINKVDENGSIFYDVTTDSLETWFNGNKNNENGESFDNTLNTWYDLTENKNNATFTGSTNWETDEDGNYFYFDSSNYGEFTNLNTNSYKTIQVDCKFDTTATAYNTDYSYFATCIVGCELSGVQRDWQILVDKNGYFSVGYSTNTIYSSNIFAFDNSKHLITVSYQPDHILFYIDGKFIANISYVSDGTQIANWGLGYNHCEPSSVCNGLKIYDLKVYSKELSQNEITNNFMNNTLGFINYRYNGSFVENKDKVLEKINQLLEKGDSFVITCNDATLSIKNGKIGNVDFDYSFEKNQEIMMDSLNYLLQYTSNFNANFNDGLITLKEGKLSNGEFEFDYLNNYSNIFSNHIDLFDMTFKFIFSNGYCCFDDDENVVFYGYTGYRYVKYTTNGSNIDGYNDIIELEAIAGNSRNVALNIMPTTNSTSPQNLARTTDGKKKDYVDLGNNGPTYVQVDLGKLYPLTSVNIWNFYNDKRKYNVNLEVSIDGTDWTTLWNYEVDGTYVETSEGKEFPLVSTESYITYESNKYYYVTCPETDIIVKYLSSDNSIVKTTSNSNSSDYDIETIKTVFNECAGLEEIQFADKKIYNDGNILYDIENIYNSGVLIPKDTLETWFNGNMNNGENFDSSLSKWYDLTDNVNNASFNGSTQWGKDNDGAYYYFDGSNYGRFTNLNTDSYKTIQVDCKFDTTATSYNTNYCYFATCIVGCELSGTQKDWQILVNKDGYFSVGYSNKTIYSSNIYAFDGKKHNVAVSYQSDHISFYIDGQSIARIGYTPGGTNISTWGFGYNTAESSSVCNGLKLYDLKVYSNELNETEILQNYNDSINNYQTYNCYESFLGNEEKILAKIQSIISNNNSFTFNCTDAKLVVTDGKITKIEYQSDFTSDSTNSLNLINILLQNNSNFDIYFNDSTFSIENGQVSNVDINLKDNVFDNNTINKIFKEFPYLSQITNYGGPKYQYIKYSTNHSSVNNYNYIVELEAITLDGKNVALNVLPTTNVTSASHLSYATDGNKSSSSAYVDYGSTSPAYTQIDLGKPYLLSSINVWNYWSDNRQYNVKLEVSLDGNNWTTLWDYTVDGTYPETSEGKSFPINSNVEIIYNIDRHDEFSIDKYFYSDTEEILNKVDSLSKNNSDLNILLLDSIFKIRENQVSEVEIHSNFEDYDTDAINSIFERYSDLQKIDFSDMTISRNDTLLNGEYKISIYSSDLYLKIRKADNIVVEAYSKKDFDDVKNSNINSLFDEYSDLNEITFADQTVNRDSNLIGEYTQVSYIESTGTQYIDAGIYGSDTLGFEVDYQTQNTVGTSEYGSIFGTRTANKSGEYLLSSYGTGGCFGLNTTRYTANMVQNRKEKFVYRHNTYTTTSNITGSVQVSPFTTQSSITVFATNQIDVPSLYGKSKLYSLKFYNDTTDTLIRNFIPVLNRDGTACLYDLVTEKYYYNSGTGEFFYNTKDEVPNENYTKLDYIESTGTQYIDTGIYGSNTLGFEVDYQTQNTVGTSGYGNLFAARKASKSFEYAFGSYGTGGMFGTYNTRYTVNMVKNRREKVLYRNNSLTSATGVVTNTISTEFTTPCTITIFTLNQNGTVTQSGKFKLYNLKFYDDTTNTLVRDYIPVLDNNGVACLYDLVTEKYYYNSGTGDFSYAELN